MPETKINTAIEEDFIHNLDQAIANIPLSLTCGTRSLGVDLRKACQKMLFADQSPDTKLTTGQADQIIEALWTLCQSMVDLAFKSGPVDHAFAARDAAGGCGQLHKKKAPKCDKAASAMLSSSHSKTEQTRVPHTACAPVQDRGES